MHRRLLSVSFLVLACVFLVSHAKAGMTKQEFKHADKNKDGTVDKKEYKMKQQQEEKLRKVNNWWEKRADTNGDGVVSSDELSSWKKLEKEKIDLNGDGTIDAKEQRMCWAHARSRVNTDVEKKYDANGDGWLEPSEVKQLLQDKQTLIKTNGKAKVDTQIENEYDTNNDGVIDASEAGALKEDLED